MSNNTQNINRPLEPKKRAIVIGASSGIGAALTQKLAQQGYIVAAIARRDNKLQELSTTINAQMPSGIDRVYPYQHDVTDFTAVPPLFQDIVRDIGGLDLIVYVAGTQPQVDLHEYNFEKDAAMIQTNLLGAIAWLNQAAMRFERGRGGQIVGVSSIAGDRGRVGAPVYNTSKAGLNTYLEALRNRLANRGVTVTTIKPGFVDTVLLENAPKTFWVISPEEAAVEIYKAIQRKKQTVYIPKRWGLVGLIIRHIPSPIFKLLRF